MTPGWQVDAFIDLIRTHYDTWDNFAHPPFVEDEIAYKQKTIAKAQEWLTQAELDRLIAAEDYDTILERLDKLSKDNNLLWRRIPAASDTAVLTHPTLDKPLFCTHMRNLLYAARPTPERLQTFSDYLTAHELPNKWPFPTYFLFLCHPQTEILVRSRPMRWFLQFMGENMPVRGAPTADVYAAIRHHAHDLKAQLAPYGAQDMVDIQSLIWVCAQAAKERTGKLTAEAQVDLDIPPTEPLPLSDTYAATTAETAVLHEPDDTPYLFSDQRPFYTLEACAAATGYPLPQLTRWVEAADRKKQLIFYGPPGTGKTFMAQQLARHLAGQTGLVQLVQFHPAYAYEDFMQGIRPRTQPDGTLHYQMVPGRFYDFCQQAQGHPDRCVFIIDEINRANLAQVFGELMYLLEYRDQRIPLAGGGPFHIPQNVYILATMNTADRSIALVDYALRRRFAFIQLTPQSDLLRHYHRHHPFQLDALIDLLQQINQQIGDPHYQLGMSFFMHPELPQHLENIWRMEIEPYLEEYFFDQMELVEMFRWQQVSSLIGQLSPSPS